MARSPRRRAVLATLLALTRAQETITNTFPACTNGLTQSDVDNSWGNPCPWLFEPLPAQGALSGTQLTVFGLPGLADYDGSVIGADGTSTTYALTCLDSDGEDTFVGAQCTSTGVVLELTASAWNWHLTTTQIDEADFTSAVSITATVDPAGGITVDFLATVTASVVSAYQTTNTWTGDVAFADPSVVPLVGLTKIERTDAPSMTIGPDAASATATATATGGGSTAKLNASASSTTGVMTSSTSAGAASQASNGSGLSMSSRGQWSTLIGSVVMTLALAIVL